MALPSAYGLSPIGFRTVSAGARSHRTIRSARPAVLEFQIDGTRFCRISRFLSRRFCHEGAPVHRIRSFVRATVARWRHQIWWPSSPRSALFIHLFTVVIKNWGIVLRSWRNCMYYLLRDLFLETLFGGSYSFRDRNCIHFQ